MADKALAKRPANELAAPNATAGMAWEMEGEDRDDFLIPRVIVHQGDIAEKWYGQHPKGTLIDTSTKAPLDAASNRFMPIRAYKEYIAWSEEIGQAPVYTERDKQAVPPEDLRWTEGVDKKGNPISIPPKCTEYRNFIVLFEGSPSPVVLSLSDAKKAQREAAKFLNKWERERGTKLGRGYYTLGQKECENHKGKWLDFTVQPVGEQPPPELAEAVARWTEVLSQQTIKTNIVESAQVESEAAGGFDPDA